MTSNETSHALANAPVYLDWNATAPVREEVVAAMVETMRHVGNASSIHTAGRAARSKVEAARQQVADLIGVKSQQVIFTSGATEANNQVLKGFAGQPILISAVEHASLFDTTQVVEHIPVLHNGVVDLAWLEQRLQQEPKPALVAVMCVNNETGVIQPVRQVSKLATEKGVPVLCDAVQAAGKIPLDFGALGATWLTLSAHKLGGPQGVGAIVMAIGRNPPRLLEGGGQERRQRAGTENVAGIVGFGVAADMALNQLGNYAKTVKPLRDNLEAQLRSITPELQVFGGGDTPRVANTLCVALPGLPAETLLMNFDLAGIAISSGSACSSGTIKASHVLQAMGVDDMLARAALRFSIGMTTTQADIDRAAKAWQTITARMRAARKQA